MTTAHPGRSRPALAALLTAAILALTSACGSKPPPLEDVTLTVDGMTCASCVEAITDALVRSPGVESARVTLDPPAAVVRFQPDVTAPPLLVEAVTRLGYGARIAAPAAP